MTLFKASLQASLQNVPVSSDGILSRHLSMSSLTLRLNTKSSMHRKSSNIPSPIIGLGHYKQQTIKTLDIYFCSNGEVPFIQSISTGGVVTLPPPEPPGQLAAPSLLHTQGGVVLGTGDTPTWESASAHLNKKIQR